MRRLTLFLATLLAATVLPGAPANAHDLPVPYNFLPFAVVGGGQANAPGTNDWRCKPSAAHPRPVVLVHGLMGNKSTNWQTYGPLLHNNGYCVFALTYGEKNGDSTFGGLKRMQDSARELKRFVARVREATGARKVDLVGHSEGTLMPNFYVKFLGGSRFVKRYVSIAPLWHGTEVARPAAVAKRGLYGGAEVAHATCDACPQFSPDSRFMKRMRSGGVAVDGVDYTNVVTRYDQLVVPYTSGIQRGMRNVTLQDGCEQNFSEHFQIVADRRTSVFVLNALDPRNPRRVPCGLSGPFVGGNY